MSAKDDYRGTHILYERVYMIVISLLKNLDQPISLTIMITEGVHKSDPSWRVREGEGSWMSQLSRFSERLFQITLRSGRRVSNLLWALRMRNVVPMMPETSAQITSGGVTVQAIHTSTKMT